MAAVDPRLPEMASGLGVWEGSVQRFYPVDALRQAGGKVADQIGGRPVLVYIDPVDQGPHAVWWPYGFTLTFPGCQVYESKS